MKKLESSLKNMLLVLTGVTAISVALLAYVNELTKEPIAQANNKTVSDAIAVVVPGFDNNPLENAETVTMNGLHFTIFKATKNGEFIGAAVQTFSQGFGGPLTVLVGFDKEGKIIDYSLLSHFETPGLGSKAAGWFKPQERVKSLIEKTFGFEIVPAPKKSNIQGMNPGEYALKVNKDCEKDYEGRVDAITASTITSRAFLSAVNNAYAAYAAQNTGSTTQKNVKETADAATGATIKVEQTDSVSAK